jgi:hypothetical protein
VQLWLGDDEPSPALATPPHVGDHALGNVGDVGQVHAGNVDVLGADAAREALLEDGELRVQGVVHAGVTQVVLQAVRLELAEGLEEGRGQEGGGPL